MTSSYIRNIMFDPLTCAVASVEQQLHEMEASLTAALERNLQAEEIVAEAQQELMQSEEAVAEANRLAEEAQERASLIEAAASTAAAEAESSLQVLFGVDIFRGLETFYCDLSFCYHVYVHFLGSLSSLLCLHRQ